MPKEKPCPAGAPMWMVTFADLMALLLTLFVLLLTFANMDVVKFKKIAGSMKDALGVQKIEQLSGMIEIDGNLIAKHASNVEITQEVSQEQPTSTLDNETPAPPPPPTERQSDIPFRIDKPPAIEDRLMKALEQTVSEQLGGTGVHVQRNGDEVIIRFPSQVTFRSGSDQLSMAIDPALLKIGDILAQYPGSVTVSGHTDDVPLSGGGRFASNWGLSAGRATSVAERLLEKTPIDPKRVSISGFADTRPLVANDSAEHRAINRRVEITIQAPVGADIPEISP